MKLTAHCIVKNEDCWIWFAIHSVLPYVSQLFVYDTGSNDKTVEIIKSINSAKIIFEEKGHVDKKGLVQLRQEQVERTKTEWFLLLDGDEIWGQSQLKLLIDTAEQAPKNIVAVFNYARNCVGDIYHYLPESAGDYHIAGVKGNLNIRMIRKMKDLRLTGEYPLESYINSNGPIEKQDQNLLFCKCWYLHTTFLKRSSSDVTKTSGSFGKNKLWERGIKMDKKELPEILFQNRPESVDDPLKPRGLKYEIFAGITTPVINLRRKLR